MSILKLYPNCIPVKGYRRSIIIDFHTNNVIPIPNILYEILTEHKGKSLTQIQSFYDIEYSKTIEEYFYYLKDNNIIFELNGKDADNFPDISMEWHYPSHITNAQLEYSNFKNYTIVVDQLNELNCQLLQVRYKEYSSQEIKKDIDYFNKTNIPNLELIFVNDVSDKLCDLEKSLSLSARITKIYGFNSNCSKIFDKEEYKGARIILSKSRIENSCGYINPQGFNFNFKFFVESKNYNSCLNRKICIDRNGNIKNCLYLDESFGNISNKKLGTVIKDENFTKYWKIIKDEIEHCSNCEFRYNCMDCRAFRKKRDINSQPKKCMYNPYIAKWEHEGGYSPIKD